jgi:hypothetical protein
MRNVYYVRCIDDVILFHVMRTFRTKFYAREQYRAATLYTDRRGPALICCLHYQLRFRDRLIPPEVLEPVRRQRRVDRGAGDRPMAEPALDRPGVVPLVGEGVTAGVPQHVRVRL